MLFSLNEAGSILESMATAPTEERCRSILPVSFFPLSSLAQLLSQVEELMTFALNKGGAGKLKRRCAVVFRPQLSRPRRPVVDHLAIRHKGKWGFISRLRMIGCEISCSSPVSDVRAVGQASPAGVTETSLCLSWLWKCCSYSNTVTS